MNVRKNVSAQQSSIKNIVLKAIKDFNATEQYIIKNDLSERCICAKFAFYLTVAIQQSNYKDYCVDVEYNRGFDGNERSVKRMNDAPITVDLIVHKRGYDCNYGFDNLICIEMKKTTDRRGCSNDETRLRNMVGYGFGYCYKTGFMILINMKECRLEIINEFYL